MVDKNQALLQSDDKLGHVDHQYRSENEEILLIIFTWEKLSISSKLGTPFIN